MNSLRSLLIVFFVVLASCSSMTLTEKEQKRAELDAMLDSSIAAFIEQTPEIEQELEDSIAYAVASMKLTKVPVFGGGGGEAVFIQKKSQQRGYYSVSRFDIGGGMGARAYKVLMMFDSQEIVDKWKTGKWEFRAGAEASAGTASADGASGGKGFKVRILSEGGASATLTARVIRVTVHKALLE
jgi:hypothetical protein